MSSLYRNCNHQAEVHKVLDRIVRRYKPFRIVPLSNEGQYRIFYHSPSLRDGEHPDNWVDCVIGLKEARHRVKDMSRLWAVGMYEKGER